MKALKFLILFSTIITCVLATGCKKEETNEPEKNMPEYEPKTVDVPSTMTQSNNYGAQTTASFITMVNSMATYGGFMSPPTKSAVIRNLKDLGTESYSWEVNDGTSAYSVTLKVTETISMISWECILDGMISGHSMNNFKYIQAEESKDGMSSRFTLYDFVTSGINMDLIWQEQTNGNSLFTLEVPSEILLTIAVSNTGSGTLELKDWVNSQYMLSFKSSWDASGHGEFWEFDDDGVPIDHGEW